MAKNSLRGYSSRIRADRQNPKLSAETERGGRGAENEFGS
jgi:hypothetical protein